MIPRKFIAATSREALYKVREALGDEAIILSNKQIPGGVEIIAVLEHEMDAFAHEAHATTAEERPSFSTPEWPRYPEPGIGAAAHYQHWENVSWNPQSEEEEWQMHDAEPLSSLNQYWHQQQPNANAQHNPRHAHQAPSATPQQAPLPSWMNTKPPERAAVKQAPSSAHSAGRPASQSAQSSRSNELASASNTRMAQERSAQPRQSAQPASGGSKASSVVAAKSGSGGDEMRPRGGGRPSPSAPPQSPPHSSGTRSSSASSKPPMPMSSPSSAGSSTPPARSSKDEVTIQHELKLLRSMLEGQLAGFAWNELSQRSPLHLTLMRWMLSTGMSPALSREVLEGIPQTQDIMEAMGQIRQRLSQRIDCMPAEEDIIDQGGVYALVGTTGVGKTTTVAKLAARCTLKHGPQHVALLTTDSYRIGAHDQLKAYGRILSVPVYGIRDESDLVSALNDLSTRRLILIDTIGMSQRDRRLVEQIALLGRQGGKVQQLLLIAANAQASTLEDVVRAYGSSQLAGVIISKLDETAQIGSVLDILIRHRLRLCYLTDGQRVPEDLHLPNPKGLVDRAFQDILSESPLTLKEDEYPLIWK